jgi:hypothetical protein
MKYVMFYGPPADMARAREIFPEHRSWYEKFHARGLLLMIGPFADPGAPAAMACSRRARRPRSSSGPTRSS